MKRVLILAALAGLVTPFVASADELGQPGPDANVVAPDQPRGQLGGLASGAPSFSADLKTIGSVAAAPAAAPAVAAPAAGAPAAVSTTTTASQAVVVEKSASTFITDFRLVHQVIHHCMLSKLRADGLPDIFGIPAPLPFAPIPAPFGDLELLSVGMISDAADQAGPLYRISFRNNSPLPAHHFQVSLIAVLGEMNRTSPVATAHIEKIGANAVGHIDIQLPHGVMAMGPAGSTGPFEKLVAAIDSFDELAETTELNNIMTLSRIGIEVIEVASATTTTTAVAGAAAAPAVAAPAAGAAPAVAAPAPGAAAAPSVAPGAAAPAAPIEGNAAPAQPEAAPAPMPAPSGSDALDSLDLDKVEGTSDLFTR
jgi:hypothetical protein